MIRCPYRYLENRFLETGLTHIVQRKILTPWSWSSKVDMIHYCSTLLKGCDWLEQRVTISHPSHPAEWSRMLSWTRCPYHTTPDRCTSPLRRSEAPRWLKQRCWRAPVCGLSGRTETGALGLARSCKPLRHYYQFLVWWSPRWRWWASWNHSPRRLSLPLSLWRWSECIPPPPGQVSPDLEHKTARVSYSRRKERRALVFSTQRQKQLQQAHYWQMFSSKRLQKTFTRSHSWLGMGMSNT